MLVRAVHTDLRAAKSLKVQLLNNSVHRYGNMKIGYVSSIHTHTKTIGVRQLVEQRGVYVRAFEVVALSGMC